MMRRGPEEDRAQHDSASGCCRPGPGPPPSAGLHSDPDPGPPSPVSTFALQGSLGVGVPMAGPSALRYPSPTSVLGSSGQRWVRKPPGSERHGCGHGRPALASKEGQEGPGVSAQSPCPSFSLQALGGLLCRALPAPGSRLRGTTLGPSSGGQQERCASITSGSDFGEPGLSASGH